MARRRVRSRAFLEGTVLEKLFYELKPFLCMGGAAYLLREMDLMKSGQLAAMLLFGCGLFILVERLRYRGYLK